MNSLEEKFRQSKRSHTFVETISLIGAPREPKPETRTSEPDNTLSSAPLDQGEPALPTTPASEILQGLRQDWLTREPDLPPENGEPAQTSRKSRSKQQRTIPNYTPFIESVKASLRKRASSVATRRQGKGETEKSAAKLVMIMVVCLAVLLAIGALLYATTMDYIFGPARLSTVMRQDAPETSPAGNPPVPTLALANPTKLMLDIAATASKSGTGDVSGDPHGHATLSDKNLILLDQTIARTAVGLASKAGDRQTQSGTQSSSTAHPPPVSTGRGQPPDGGRPPSIAGPEATPATSRDLVRAGQDSLQRKDFQGAHALAVPPGALNPTALPALERTPANLAAQGNPRDAEAAALAVIAHGGKAVFELQHFHPSPVGLHPAKIAIAATTLEFIPEAPDPTRPFTIPLASITSVQVGQNSSNLYLLTIKFSARGTGGELSFSDSSAHVARQSNEVHFSSQLTPAQETALFTAIRNVLLTTKGRS